MFNKFLLVFLFIFSSLYANEVKIVKVQSKCSTLQVCSFDVTLLHKDEGWEHYANKWEIFTKDGEKLASRTLYHPHVSEQPFTRGISGIQISKGIKKVYVKAYDTVHMESPDVYEYVLK